MEKSFLHTRKNLIQLIDEYICFWTPLFANFLQSSCSKLRLDSSILDDGNSIDKYANMAAIYCLLGDILLYSDDELFSN